MKIITDKKKLDKPCESCTSIKEGLKIGNKLLKYLKEHENGVGLAANQVGINKRVCVVNVDKPMILVNPKIIGKFKKIQFLEACLSFPGSYIVTDRYENIAVNADNHERTLIFGAENLLKTVCVQHEIDHLNGFTMFDRQSKGERYGDQQQKSERFDTN